MKTGNKTQRTQRGKGASRGSMPDVSTPKSAGKAERQQRGRSPNASRGFMSDRTVARMVMVPESRIPKGSKLCVVLVSEAEVMAILKVKRAMGRGSSVECRVSSVEMSGLGPLLAGIVRAWMMG